MSDSVRPHRWQPTRLPCPWDSPGKNTRVGCHFLLQCHCEKRLILQCFAFFIAQFSQPYMTIGKTTALTILIFVGKVMSLLFNILSRLIIDFLSRSKCLVILWLQSQSGVILEPKKIKSATVSTVSPSICHEELDMEQQTGSN